MKKLVFLAIIFLGLSLGMSAGFAAEAQQPTDWDGCRPQQRQQVQQISNPTLNGIYISSTSDQDGVCQSLGFQRSAEGSEQTSGAAVGPVVVVGSDGRISSGAIVDSSSGYYISGILCINPTGQILDIPQVINTPNLNGVYFSSTSDQNGICQALGFQKAAVGSMKTDGSPVGSTLVVGDGGTITSGAEVTSQSGYFVSEMICVNQQSSPIPASTVQEIEKPALNGVYFSSTSDQDGVCRALGYNRAADGAIQTDGSAAGEVLVVDNSGKITGGAVVDSSSGFWISEIVCLNQ